MTVSLKTDFLDSLTVKCTVHKKTKLSKKYVYNFHELNTLISLSDSARLNPLYHSCIVSSLYFVCFTWKCQVVNICLFDKIIN